MCIVLRCRLLRQDSESSIISGSDVKHSTFLVTKLILSDQFTAISVTVFSKAHIRVGTVPSKTDIT